MIINSVSYDLVLGYTSAQDPKLDTVKFRSMVSGLVDPLSYGARQERIAEFTLINIEKSQFVALVDYLIANAGNKVLIQAENDGEKIFTGISGNDYYVYILEPKGLQEEDFSVTDNLYTVSIKVALAGTESDDIPNESNSNFDALITIDTVQADYYQASEPGAWVDGERWMDTDDNSLYENVSGTAEFLYTVIADNVVDGNITGAELGLINGKFHLATFADVSADLPDDDPDNGTITFKAGFLTYKNINLPSQNTDLNKGPSIARREGFSFSLSC